MPEPPPDWTPPPRGLLYARPVAPEDGGGVLIGCDCGAQVHLIIEDADKLTAPVEMSFVCGCLSVHWFTVRPAGAVAGG